MKRVGDDANCVGIHAGASSKNEQPVRAKIRLLVSTKMPQAKQGALHVS